MTPQLKTNPVHLDNFRVSLDSGAHTLYNFMFAGASGVKGTFSRENASYEYMETQAFKDYLEGYIKFLHEYGHEYEFYVTLDIIGNPEKSWEVTEYMESCGLHPIPVYHFGEDIKWMERMVEKYDYVGIGGLGQDITKEKFLPFGDKAFNVVQNEDGTPKVKTHGFAMASPELILRYPWHTCDASTWTALSRNGTIYIPKPIIRNQKVTGFNYLKIPMSLPTSTRRTSHVNHMVRKTPFIKEVLEKYFSDNGFTIEDTAEYNTRDILNIRYFQRLQEAAKAAYKEKWDYEQGANILLAGTPSGASTNLSKVIDMLDELQEPDTQWLGSYYYHRHNNNLRKIRECHVAGKDLRTLQVHTRKATKPKPEPKKKKAAPVERRKLTLPAAPTGIVVKAPAKKTYMITTVLRYEVEVESDSTLTDTQRYEEGNVKLLLKGDTFFKGKMEQSNLMIQTDIEGTK